VTMTAESFETFLENAAMALLLMLAVLAGWVILKRMSSAMRKGVIAAESHLVDGLKVTVNRATVVVGFTVPDGWTADCHLTLVDESRVPLKTLHAGPLERGDHSFSCDVSEIKAAFVCFETRGQSLERRIT